MTLAGLGWLAVYGTWPVLAAVGLTWRRRAAPAVLPFEDGAVARRRSSRRPGAAARRAELAKGNSRCGGGEGGK